MNSPRNQRFEQGLQNLANRISQTLERDALVQQTTDNLRATLTCDRLVVYYFYGEWKGQVIFESLRDRRLSIYGSTGADNCFNEDYASLYQAGRARAIADIETAAIHPCHREFLQSIQVRANLAVPILNSRRLWGLLIAHQCYQTRCWSTSDIKQMQTAAETIATAPPIRNN